MTRLSDIYSSYGKQFGIATADTLSSNVLNSQKLPPNMLIAANPMNSAYEDLGTHSLIVTDSDGSPIRLTYSIRTGNGLIERKDGSVRLSIDNKSIKENEYGKLYANLAYFVNENGFEIVNGKLSINVAGLPKASDKQFGVFKIDEVTIKSDSGTIHIDSTKLDHSNNTSGMYGTIWKKSDTINVNNGILSANISGFQRATSEQFGTIRGDGKLIDVSNGIIAFSYSSIAFASEEQYGLSVPDNKTLTELQNGEISIDYSSFPLASNVIYGLIKPDDDTLEMTTNGALAVKGYSSLQEAMLEIGNNITYLDNRIKKVENDLAYLDIFSNTPKIISFYCDGLSSTDLAKPTEYGEFVENMPLQKIHATFIINTNCPFRLSIEYLDNIDPEVTLYEINYDDVDILHGNLGLTKIFQSTKRKDVKVTLYWLCKNYRHSDLSEFSNKTRINIKAFYVNDSSVNKELMYSVTRYNSLYKEEDDDNGEIIIDDDPNGPTINKINYILDLIDTSNGILVKESGLSGIENGIRCLSYIVAGNPVHLQNGKRTQVLADISQGNTVNILRKKLRNDDNSVIDSSAQLMRKNDLVNGNLQVTAFEYGTGPSRMKLWNNTNMVEFDLDDFGNIILKYLGKVNTTETIEPDIFLNFVGINGTDLSSIMTSYSSSDPNTPNPEVPMSYVINYEIAEAHEVDYGLSANKIFEQVLDMIALRGYYINNAGIQKQCTINHDKLIIETFEGTIIGEGQNKTLEWNKCPNGIRIGNTEYNTIEINKYNTILRAIKNISSS